MENEMTVIDPVATAIAERQGEGVEIPEDVPDGPGYVQGHCDLKGADGCDDVDDDEPCLVNVYSVDRYAAPPESWAEATRDPEEGWTLTVCDHCDHALKALAEAMAKVQAEVDRKAQWISDAHAMIDWIEGRDLVPSQYNSLSLAHWVTNPEALPDAIKAMGTAEKFANDYQIGARRKFGVHTYSVSAGRDSVCEKVITGTKVVTKTAEPTVTPPEGARNVRSVTTTTLVYETDEETTEWVCPPSLLAHSLSATQSADADVPF
jgi:hypothetical protein